ncbi:hypothetical protein [Pedobacter sp. L105]|uniref:hypothetical protein n=1 Tax=Pedobacter sp. L105 TaxID=1641871 RepID=UPI00131C5AA7|nr:hypothetical protein [Pedobacter sp. L105]
MKRKLLFAERMLYGNGETPFNVVIPVKINGSFPAENLYYALDKIQEKYPLLNAGIENDEEGRPWFVVHPKTFSYIPVRIIIREGNDDWERESVKEWYILFNSSKGPLVRLVWIKGDSFSELLLVSHHCLCDGGVLMSILADLLVLLDNGQVDIGKENPILKIEDIIPPSILKNKKKLVKAKLIGSFATLVLWLIPLQKRLIDRKKDYLIHWKLDKELSGQLIATCKSEGITVNTALCVAVLNAFKKVRKEKFHNKISCPVDIRKFTPEIKKDNIFAFGLMLVVSADEKLDLLNDARKMQEDISKKTAKLNPYETIMVMEKSHASLTDFNNFLKYGKSSNDCMFSNLGKIDIPYQYHSFEVETLYSPSVIGPLGNTTTLLTSTYRGQLDFTFIGSEGFLPYQEALAIQKELIHIITIFTKS